MPYDPTIYGPSILIDGVDTRQIFGFEPLDPVGRSSLAFNRREFDLPFRQGVVSQGGTYDPTTVAVSGWIDKSKLFAFSRFLFTEDTLRPTRARGRRSLIFWDQREVEYTFDTVASFSESEFTKRWMGSTYIKVTISFDIVGAFPNQAGTSDFGISSPWRLSPSPQNGQLSNPAFFNVFSSLGVGARTHENVSMKLGKADAGLKLISFPRTWEKKALTWWRLRILILPLLTWDYRI